jgi:hypothetical protein
VGGGTRQNFLTLGWGDFDLFPRERISVAGKNPKGKK